MSKLKYQLKTLFDEHGLQYSDEDLRKFTQCLTKQVDKSGKQIVDVYPKGDELVEKKQWQIWR